MASGSAPTVSQAGTTVGLRLVGFAFLRVTLRSSLFVLTLEGAAVLAMRAGVGSASLYRSTGRPGLRVATKQPETRDGKGNRNRDDNFYR